MRNKCDVCGNERVCLLMDGDLFMLMWSNKKSHNTCYVCGGCVTDAYDYNGFMIQEDTDEFLELIITEYSNWDTYKSYLKYDERNEEGKSYLRNTFIKGINNQIEFMDDPTNEDEIDEYRDYLYAMVGGLNQKGVDNLIEIYDNKTSIPSHPYNEFLRWESNIEPKNWWE